jgi:hypothetical protein
MLRSGLLLFGIVLTGIGLALMVSGTPSWQPFLIWGAILTIAVLCERWRYRRIEHSAGERWRPTGERFEDPETGRTVEVLYDPATGERRYAPINNNPAPPKKQT